MDCRNSKPKKFFPLAKDQEIRKLFDKARINRRPIPKLPASHWKKNMLFFGADNKNLLDQTGGQFPAGNPNNTTHPIFVLEVNPGYSNEICPCSSAIPNRHNAPNGITRRYIIKTCSMTYIPQNIEKDTFILEEYFFQVPADPSVAIPIQENGSPLYCAGVVPPHCIRTVSS